MSLWLALRSTFGQRINSILSYVGQRETEGSALATAVGPRSPYVRASPGISGNAAVSMSVESRQGDE